MQSRLLIRCAPVVAALLLSACGTFGKVGAIDPTTGRITTAPSTYKATTVLAEKTDLARFKAMVYTSNSGEYMAQQLRAIKYFDAVLDHDDLQKLIVDKQLQDSVPNLRDPLDLNKLARVHEPFLWIRMQGKQIDGVPYLELVVTDTSTLKELFIARIRSHLFWEGSTDQVTRYPLFNALLDWIQQNR